MVGVVNATMSRGSDLQRIIGRDRALLLASAIGVGTTAWLFMWSLHSGTHLWQPHWQAWGWAAFARTAGAWMVMMVAMMLPAVLPWALFFARSNRLAPSSGRTDLSFMSFLSGYFVLWLLYSVAAAALQVSLQHVAASRPIPENVTTMSSGVVLLLAGAFQLTAFKQACLRHCRSPLGFFLTRWQDGPAGAFGMGLRHGVFCVGCCWALMVLAIAAGVMNLMWMILLTAVICVETLAPHGDRIGRGIGVVLMVWGTMLILLSPLA
jgi:predicted metal-binding membrane protein